MEKHDIIMMVGILSLATVLALGINTTCALAEEDDSEKDLCKDNDGKWKDGGCVFKEDDGIDKEQNEVNFEHDLADMGMWETSNERNEDVDDNIKVINSDDDDGKKYGFTSKEGDAEVTRYYDDKDEAEEKYKDLDRDELTHSDKSYSDWEYDDEEHPALK